jgi:hypothetical protein
LTGFEIPFSSTQIGDWGSIISTTLPSLEKGPRLDRLSNRLTKIVIKARKLRTP